MSYDNSNRLALWLNKKREQQTHPHINGSGETNEPVFVSGWFAQDIDPDDAKALMGIIKRHAESSSKPFLSISIKSKNQSNGGAPF